MWSDVDFVADLVVEGFPSLREAAGTVEAGMGVYAHVELPRRTCYLAVQRYADGTGAASVELSGHAGLPTLRFTVVGLDPVRAWRRVRRLAALAGVELPRAARGMLGGLS